MKKYFLEFLVVFFGILLSFMIDNRMKYSERVDNKNFLLGQLNEVIKEDQIQLKIVESTLNDCLESISILIYDYKNKILHDSVVVKHFSNVSSKMSISFFPQKSIYNQIVQSQYLELIENKKLKENLASLYEHLNDRNESVNLKYLIQKNCALELNMILMIRNLFFKIIKRILFCKFTYNIYG